MSVQDTSQWISFFMKAGLPSNVAANYALIFSENRIQLDMLMDLSKEYLYDMGIKVMGDVIAILRYAKEYHNQLAKERVIGTTTNPAANKNAVAGRMVGHYTRPLSSTNKSLVISDQGSGKNVVNLKRRSETESSPKKIRKVPPEEEGAYKIKMPLGITEKTRKILQQQQLVQSSKQSIFSRLDNTVSSSTDCKNSSVFQRLGPSNKNRDDVPTSTVKSGQKTAPLQYQGVLKLKPTQKRIVSANIPKKGTVPARTVITSKKYGLDNITKTININRINTILKSNQAPNKVVILNKNKVGSQGIFGRQASQKASIKSRLGQKIDARNMARTKMLVKSKKQNTNVFDRLGR